MKVNNKKLPWITTLLLVLTFSVMQLRGQYVSDADKQMAQKAAQHFVKRMLETRDVSSLIKEMFLPSFIPRYACEVEGDSPTFYLRLTKSERLRLFKAQINARYLVSIDVLQGTDYIQSKPENTAFTGIVPPEIAERLRKVLGHEGKSPQFSDYKDFQLRLPKVEKALSEARDYLKKRGIEQTSEFQKELDDRIIGEGLLYKVEVGAAGEYATVCGEFGNFPAKQKLFYVTTPLFFAVVLVKDGEQMKIVALTDADDD